MRVGGGGGGAVRFRPDTKSGGGGGVLFGASGPIQKAGKGRGCLAEEGALPYMKGGGCNPQTPPWIRLWYWLLRMRCYCLNWLDTETEGST